MFCLARHPYSVSEKENLYRYLCNYIYIYARCSSCMWRFAPTLQMYLSVVPTRGDKATATMADIKSEAEMQCPEELPEYTSAAPTIRTDSVEADPQNSEETRSVREMEEGVPKGNKAITDTFDEDLMDCCFLTATALMGVGVFAFAIGMLYLMLERIG